MPFLNKNYQQILNTELSHLTAASVITDANTGSVARTMTEGHALVVDEAYYQLVQLINSFYFSTSTGSDLDRRASDFLEQRQLSEQATVNVSFGGSGSPVIPAGLLITSSANPAVVFITAQDSTLSTPVPAICQTSGSIGNIQPSTLDTILNNPDPVHITSVTNAAASSGGFDQEADATFLSAVQAFMQSLSKGTPVSIKSACLNTLGINTVAIIPKYGLTFTGGNTNNTQDLNTSTAATLNSSAGLGNFLVVIDNGSGNLPFSIVPEVLTTLDGNPSDPIDFPGFVGAGVQAFVSRPSLLPVSVALTIAIDPTANATTVLAALQTALGNFIMQQPIGGEILLSEIVDQAMNIPGITDVAPFSDITLNGNNADLPATNVATKFIVSGSWLTVTVS